MISRPKRICADKLQLLDVVVMPGPGDTINVGTIESLRIEGDDVTFVAFDGRNVPFEYTTSQGNEVDIVRMEEA